MKKFLAALVGAGIAFTTMLGNPVSATNIDTDVGGTVIETRYQEISYIVADISIKNGVVFSTGSYHVWLENPEVKLKVIVQESANGKDWEDVKSERYTISLQRDDATILYDGDYSLRCRYRRCGRSSGKHLGHGIHADQDRCQQRGVSRHRPDPRSVLLRQTWYGLF